MTPGLTPPPSCWGSIGVTGDRSCPELANVIHCRNCPVMLKAAAGLFDAAPPPGYADAWAAIVAQAPARRQETTSALIFRVAAEWLSVETAMIAEIAAVRPIHRIPHRAQSLLSGLVNIRGQLYLCVSLAGILGMPQPAETDRRRLVVIAQGSDTYVFAVSEIHGVHQFPTAAIGPAPDTLPPALAVVTRGIFSWGDRKVGLLSGHELVSAMKRVIA